jgi:class 3 adenylate cyclase/tetratricopeptide (TPR) repeat protein
MKQAADANQSNGERRHLAVLFADLCDSTRISGALEPEQFAALLGQLRSLTDTIIARHGGIVVRIDGDGATCVFGYPKAVEDAGRRATEAALDLHAAASTLDLSFAFPDVAIRLHSGVHSGVVLVREGDLVRGRIEILGDTTNVAARLCDHAGPDEIVVSDTCLGGDRHFFLSSKTVDVPLRGRSGAISALVIGGRATVETRFAARAKRGIAPFSGRRNELAMLRRMFDETQLHGLRRVMIVGEPGIGKTRLMSQFLDAAAADGIAVHRGYCEAYLAARPLQAFDQVAQSIRAAQHADAMGDDSGLAHRIRSWASIDDRQTAILAIDDWQWADDATHALLEEICRSARRRMMVVLATRPDTTHPSDDSDGMRLELGPLLPVDAEQAVVGLLSSADPFRVDRICAMSGGSPLFIEELCHASDSILPDTVGDSGHSAWLDGLVQARFLELPDDQARLLRVASVIGHIFPVHLFCRVAQVGENDSRLAALHENDFLYEGEVAGTLRFKHALTRDAIYRTVGYTERQLLHATVAEELESLSADQPRDDQLDALAYHLAACGKTEKATRCAIEAGDKAMAVAALDRAQGHYRYALAHSASAGLSGDSLVELIVKFGRAAVVDPSREQLPILESAGKRGKATGNRDAAMFAAYWSGAIQYGLGEAQASLASIAEARTMLEPGRRPGFETQILANLGQAHAIAGQFADARNFIGQAIDLARHAPKRGKPNPGMAYAFASRGYVLAVQGHFSEAYSDFAGGLEALNGVDHPVRSSIQSLRSLACLAEGRIGDCLSLIRQSIAISLSSRARYLVVSCRAVEDYAQWRLTGESSHVEALKRRVDWLLASASRQRLSNDLAWLTEMSVALGRIDDAQHYHAATCQRAEEGDRLGEALSSRAMARLASSKGSADKAFAYLEQAYGSADILSSPRERSETHLCAADIHRAMGNYSDAEAKQAQAVAGFVQLSMTERLEQIRTAAQHPPRS